MQSEKYFLTDGVVGPLVGRLTYLDDCSGDDDDSHGRDKPEFIVLEKNQECKRNKCEENIHGVGRGERESN